MPKRERNCSQLVSFSFFCWCVMFCAFARLAQAIALDRSCARMTVGWPLCFDGRLVRVEDLDRIVAAAAQALQLIVRQVLDQSRAAADRCRRSARGRRRRDSTRVLLILAVHDLAHALGEQPVVVAREQLIPVAAPQDLDDVPAGAAEERFELLHDLPLPRTGPSRRCRLQLMTQIRLSSFSRAARRDGAERFGLVRSPSPRNAQTLSARSPASDPRSSR